ncbi:hypothetical protein HMPREF3192_00037 [Atopobium deltae]|uniref:Uncharacterized protein n=1 Tax=Atopobium deltae TaxID=1393034 RepID=A0A133XXE4_9ACTN|nr:hypothetical protein HMPREF3192_00037 [Atopobium deltae]
MTAYFLSTKGLELLVVLETLLQTSFYVTPLSRISVGRNFKPNAYLAFAPTA